jgi:TPR repeat protein
MYAKGEGVKEDRAQAIAWLEKAAAQGHAEAKRKLYVLKGR